MFKNKTSLIFFSTLVLGTLISISSNSWLGAWMGLEINLLSFIPLVIKLNNSLSTESALKYFLTQALASSILLFSIIMFFLTKNNFLLEKMNFIWILNFSLLMKMGAAPFHFWFPEMMEGLSWMTSLILMTWQKIAPMILIYYCFLNSLMFLVAILSIIMGSLGGLNQINLKKLLAYSSINHLGWMLSSMMISINFWMFYFFIYSIITFSLVILFNQYNLYFMNQIFNYKNFHPIIKFMIFCNILSLGGLPPFTGFLPKWIIIQAFSQYSLVMITFMVIFTLVTLFFYIRLGYSAFMINYTQLKWNSSYELNLNTNLIFNFFVITSLPLMSLIYLTF
uniref:NADH-ubiquinone oxidoreductase chain 2 n=1 Tax=Micromus angulatus TaxID=1230847 RepID=A0A4D6NYF2_9NEOP|nr:NADH dehydrogenase subunit 2 [Micromus angulatus]QCE31813.1 NADH dehydrogenase subunit 2 [Micromus angulatus]